MHKKILQTLLIISPLFAASTEKVKAMKIDPAVHEMNRCEENCDRLYDYISNGNSKIIDTCLAQHPDKLYHQCKAYLNKKHDVCIDECIRISNELSRKLKHEH